MEHFDKTMKILTNAICSVSEHEYNTLKRDCIRVINSGGKLIATGLGKNVAVCEKFVGTLNSIGIPAAFMHTNSAIHGDLGLVKNEDLVIILTKSGETAESIYLVRQLKKRKCCLWLLSFCKNSTLYNELPNHLIIDLSHEGDEWNTLPNNSTVLNLIILQELAMQIIKEQGITIDELRLNHPGGAIGEQLK